jgi:hypothetical protein
MFIELRETGEPGDSDRLNEQEWREAIRQKLKKRGIAGANVVPFKSEKDDAA